MTFDRFIFVAGGLLRMGTFLALLLCVLVQAHAVHSLWRRVRALERRLEIGPGAGNG